MPELEPVVFLVVGVVIVNGIAGRIRVPAPILLVIVGVAVARKAGLPRNVVTVLEGESLFNDATSLVLLRGRGRRCRGRVPCLGTGHRAVRLGGGGRRADRHPARAGVVLRSALRRVVTGQYRPVPGHTVPCCSPARSP